MFNNFVILQSLITILASNLEEILALLLIMSLLFLQFILLLAQLAYKLHFVDDGLVRALFTLEGTDATKRTFILYFFQRGCRTLATKKYAAFLVSA